MAEGAAIYRTLGLTKSYGEGATAVHALRGVDLTGPLDADTVAEIMAEHRDACAA